MQMQMTIKKKLFLTISSIAAIIMIEASTVYYIEVQSEEHAAMSIKLHKDTIFLKGRLIDHLHWVNDLLESAVSGKKFTGEINPAKCAFGKWYYEYINSDKFNSLDSETKHNIREIESHHTKLHSSATRINDAKSIQEALYIYNTETKESVNSIQSLFDIFTQKDSESIENYDRERESLAHIAEYTSLSMIAVSIIVALILGFFIVRSVSRAFDRFSKGFEKVATGDLTFMMATDTKDEFGKLAEKFNSFTERIRYVVTEILEMSSQLAASSEELSSAALSFSDNSQSQASSSEEVTATIEQISAGMDNVAERAVQQASKLDDLMKIREELSARVQMMQQRVNNAMKLSSDIEAKARSGESSLSEMDGSIQRIGTSSGEVSNIVKIINDISEQINLLSLNAAIEAARAGDSGRGFAVVADEISKLADQTAASIKDIDKLIKANEGEIKNGLTSVKNTVDVISVIIQGVTEISSMMKSIEEAMSAQVEINIRANAEMQQIKQRSDEIKNSSEEQKIATEEIVKSITDISSLTQVTASGAEEMTANAEEISGMADRLKSRVDYFTV